MYHAVDEDVADELDELSRRSQSIRVEDEGSVSSDLDIDILIETDAEELFKQENITIEKIDGDNIGYEIEYVEEGALQESPHVVVQSDLNVEIDEMSTVHVVDKDINSKAIDKAFMNIFISTMSTELAGEEEFRKFCSLLNYQAPATREVNNRIIFQ